MNTDKLEETAIRHIRHDQVTRRSLATSQQLEQESQQIEQASGEGWGEDIELMELWLVSHKKDVGVWW